MVQLHGGRHAGALDVERYSLKIILIVSGTESRKRFFRSSSNLFAISSVNICLSENIQLRYNYLDGKC